MSTTFQVYTPTKDAPTFDEVLELSNKYLQDFLNEHNIIAPISIDVKILENETNSPVLFKKIDRTVWTDNKYAWFFIDGVGGGCDAYYKLIDDLERECWEDEIRERVNAQRIEKLIRKCMNSGFYWCFRRSVGQPAIINLSYGLIAAAFAKLTTGFIYSCDASWNYAIFPTDADYFLSNYFNLDFAHSDDAEWTKQNLKTIKETYRSK